MAFKTWKRYSEKKMKKLNDQQNAYMNELQEFSQGNSSDSSFEKDFRIISRDSVDDDDEHPDRPDYNRQEKYVYLPNTEIYKDDICLYNRQGT